MVSHIIDEHMLIIPGTQVPLPPPTPSQKPGVVKVEPSLAQTAAAQTVVAS